MSTTNATAPTGQTTYSDALRTLASLADEHPHLVRGQLHHLVYCTTREELIERVRALGGDWQIREDENDADPYFTLVRTLGPDVEIHAYTKRANAGERKPVTVEGFVIDPELLALVGGES